MTNNNVQPFEFEGNKVRALADGDEVMFVASDIAKILGYRDAANLTRNLDGDERGTHEVSIPSGTQNMTVLTESGLYRAILSRETSYVKNKEAQAFVKRFQRWVTHEVLPSIRKHGGYMAGQERMTPEQMALASMRWLQSKVDEQDKQLKAQEGKVLFANAVESAKTSILVGDLAKILKGNGVDIGQKRLFAWLREHGWLIKAKGSSWNMPIQKSMDLGLFEIKETTVTHADGHTTINKTPKVTGKGQTYFTNLFLKPTLGATARAAERTRQSRRERCSSPAGATDSPCASTPAHVSRAASSSSSPRESRPSSPSSRPASSRRSHMSLRTR